jgi:hypothetical protein
MFGASLLIINGTTLFPPAGYLFVVTSNGSYVQDSLGNYVIVPSV